MRLFKGLISIILAVALFSCATTEKQPETVTTTEPEKVEESVTEKKMVEVELEKIEYYVVNEEAFYGDGQIDTITKYSYDEDFNLVSKIQENEQGEALESFYNTIEAGVVVKRDNYGFLNQLNNYMTFEYNADGLVTKDMMFNDEDKLQSSNEYEYDGQNVVVWRTLGPSGGLLAITEYEYDSENNNTKVLIKDALGSVDGTIEKMYKDGLLIEEKVLDSKGNMEKSTQYVYDGDILVERVFFNKRGKKSRSEAYEFDAEVPVPNKVSLLYNSGEVDVYTLYEYETRVVKYTVMVEE